MHENNSNMYKHLVVLSTLKFILKTNTKVVFTQTIFQVEILYFEFFVCNLKFSTYSLKVVFYKKFEKTFK